MTHHLILKRFFVFFTVLFSLTSCNKDAIIADCYLDIDSSCSFVNFYYYENEPFELGKMSNDFLLIGFDSIRSNNEIVSFINSQCYFNDVFENDVIGYPNYEIKHVVMRLTKSRDCNEIASIIKHLNKYEIVEYQHYCIQTDDCSNDIWEIIGDKCVDSYSDFFYVRVMDSNDLHDLNQIVSETNTEIVSQNKFMRNWFTLKANKNSSGDALQMANYFHESELFEVSQPDIIKLVVE